MRKESDRIIVAVKEPGKPPVFRVIENRWEDFSDIVGGWIEIVRFPDSDLVLVCNETGKLLDLPTNFIFYGDPIAGTVVFASSRNQDLDSLNLDHIALLDHFFGGIEYDEI